MKLSDHWRVFRYNFWLYPGRPVLLLIFVGLLGILPRITLSGTVVIMRCKACGWAAAGYAVAFAIGGLICPCSWPGFCRTLEEASKEEYRADRPRR